MSKYECECGSEEFVEINYYPRKTLVDATGVVLDDLGEDEGDSISGGYVYCDCCGKAVCDE